MTIFLKKFALYFISLLILLVLVLLIKTMLFIPEPISIPKAIQIDINTETVKNRLSDIIKFKTISHQDKSLFDKQAFIDMQRFIENTYPLVFSTLKKETVNTYSFILKWQGKQSALKPILFLAHQDVVPVPDENLPLWTHDPFAGVIDDTYIWGRGSLDDKASLMGIFEAVTFLIQEGFQPERTLYLAFGHDEEIGGEQGAKKIAELLASRNIQLEFVLDEGGVIADGVIPGVKPSVAMIGIAEKGFLSLQLSIRVEGGHSSMPPKHTAVGILSQAIVDLEANNFPINSQYALPFFDSIARHMTFGPRLVFANAWIMKPLIEYQLANNKLTNSMVRTTTAATMFNSGIKDNVLPTSAQATINFRILPGETVASVKEYVRTIINNPDIKISGDGQPPSKISNANSASFSLLKKTIHQANGEGKSLIVSPYLVMAGTDSRHFEPLSDNVYRFLFNYTTPDDIKRLHNINERISIDNYSKVINFYYLLIKNSSQLN